MHDRIEAEGADFLTKVAEGFGILAKERNWIRIRADLQQDLVSQAIKKILFEKGLQKKNTYG